MQVLLIKSIYRLTLKPNQLSVKNQQHHADMLSVTTPGDTELKVIWPVVAKCFVTKIKNQLQLT